MLADLLEVFALSDHIILDLAYRLGCLLLRCDEVSGRIYRYFLKVIDECTRGRLDDRNRIDFVTEEFDADSILTVSYAYVDGISAYAECTALEVGLGAAVQSIDQLLQQAGHTPGLPSSDMNGLGMEIRWISDAVQT